MTCAPYYMTQASATPTGLKQLHTPSILVTSYHPDDTQTVFPWNLFQENVKVLLTSESSGLSVGRRFLQPMGDPNLIPGALSADFLDMPQGVETTRFKTSCLVGFLYHAMLFLRKANHVVHQRVWGSRYCYLTQT